MTAQNIISVYGLANATDKAQGNAWYPTAKAAAKALQEAYGVRLEVAIGVIAALSPRNKWERNLADAEALIKVYKIDPQSAANVKVCTFGKNKAKALQILALTDANWASVLAILSGPKLREFASCIIGNCDEVCIDGHAYSVWLGDRVVLAKVPAIGVKLRRQIKADYQAAAEALGVAPSVVQAVTWCAWRRIHGVTA